MDHYVLRDIPRDRWLYADRGMAKWLGWLLSDHTAYLSAKKTDQQPTRLLPEMTAKAIDQTLQNAWEKSRPIALQLVPEFASEQAAAVAGAIVGFAAGQVTIMQAETGAMVRVQVADVRHAGLVTPKHWWAA